MSDTSDADKDSIEHALGRALVWGSLDEALQAAQDPRAPSWAAWRACMPNCGRSGCRDGKAIRRLLRRR